jgi:hypothetical protein
MNTDDQQDGVINETILSTDNLKFTFTLISGLEMTLIEA